MRYILKTLLLLLVTGVSTINPLQALDSTITKSSFEKLALSDESVEKAIDQNLENLSHNVEDIYTTALRNLINLNLHFANDAQSQRIQTELYNSSRTAATSSLRFKAYLTQIALSDEEYEEWIKNNNNISSEEFFSAMANMINSNLIGSPLTEGFTKQ